MSPSLLSYYEAIEQASAKMLAAAQAGNWNEVIRLEGACVLILRQLKNAARNQTLNPEETVAKSILMRCILARDDEIRKLTEPYLEGFNQTTSEPHLLH